MSLLTEFDKQVKTLLDKEYPKHTKTSEKEFLSKLDSLRFEVSKLSLPDPDFIQGYLPFVIVVTSHLLPVTQAMSLTVKDGHAGVTKLYPHETTDFSNTTEVTIPEKNIYLLVDIDRGKDSLNLPPKEALTNILNNHRSPLTIEEGVAIITYYPEFLIKNNCFSLLGSRHPGDKRVPAIWINSAKEPNLGWCWDGNPHTWLGSASCKQRI